MLSICIVLCYWAYGSFAIRLLGGDNYNASVPLLLPLAFAQCCLLVETVLSITFALEKKSYGYFLSTIVSLLILFIFAPFVLVNYSTIGFAWLVFLSMLIRLYVSIYLTSKLCQAFSFCLSDTIPLLATFTIVIMLDINVHLPSVVRILLWSVSIPSVLLWFSKSLSSDEHILLRNII